MEASKPHELLEKAAKHLARMVAMREAARENMTPEDYEIPDKAYEYWIGFKQCVEQLIQARVELPEECSDLAFRYVHKPDFNASHRTHDEYEINARTLHRAGQLGIPMETRDWKKVRDILYAAASKLRIEASSPIPVAEDDEPEKTPYPNPATYARDKWIYENVQCNSFADLQLKLKQVAKVERYDVITSRQGFKKAADRYSDYHVLPKRRFLNPRNGEG